MGIVTGYLSQLVNNGIKLLNGGTAVSSSNPLPVVAGKSLSVTATTVASQVATSYAAGACIGTLYTFSGFFTTGIDSGEVKKAFIGFNSASLSAMINVLIFRSNPTASTITDGAAFVLDPTDLDKLSTVIQMPAKVALGASGVSTIYEAADMSRPVSGTTNGIIYAVLVAESTLTLISGDLVGFKISGSRD